MLKFLVLIGALQCIRTQENLILLTKKRSSFLENYRGYADLAISQVVIPSEVNFLSFKISAEPFDLSIFGCSPEEVYVYAKKGSLPVINPDNSRNPDIVRNISKSTIHGLRLLTDKKYSYINITSPEPGIYYFASFFPYVDPNKVAVKQKGLSQHCTGFINILTYISKPRHLRMLTANSKYHINSRSDASYYYQFSTTPNIKELFLRIKINDFSNNKTSLTLRLNDESLPSDDKYIETKTISATDYKKQIPYWLNKNGRYFLEFKIVNDQLEDYDLSLEFSLDTISLDQTFRRKNLRASLSNKLDPDLYKGAIIDYYGRKDSEINEYFFYELVKESGSESFLYTFNIKHEEENEFMIPIPLNLTSQQFTTLKFQIEDIIDVGGMFEFSIDFRLPIERNREVKLTAESVDQIIIGCISRDIYQIPTLPRHCTIDGARNVAPVVINNTIDNSTVLIPYPEAGSWYVTLKLFCRPCTDCACYRTCSDMLTSCIESKCGYCKSVYTCDMCLRDCKQTVGNDERCRSCNCDDNCEASKSTCNSTIMFDLSSFPCLLGRCGPNGRCQFMVADGYIFSACRCRNNYRGMDCTDDTDATPFWKVVLAQILLISSNVVMLPCVYIAVRRKYYSEAVMYFSVFLFSSFYHACDVSDDGLQFCITTHSSLQFGDFFSALLSIWATLLAIADLETSVKTTLHVFGAIVLAYCTVIDKTGVWIFLLIAIPGLVIVAVNWYLKYKKFGRNFIRKKYLLLNFTSGAIVMSIGISIYAFLQTSGNYMYLHSLWHCIVGTTVLLVLPKANTFVPIQES